MLPLWVFSPELREHTRCEARYALRVEQAHGARELAVADELQHSLRPPIQLHVRLEVRPGPARSPRLVHACRPGPIQMPPAKEDRAVAVAPGLEALGHDGRRTPRSTRRAEGSTEQQVVEDEMPLERTLKG